MSEEANILDMDFGELMDISGPDIKGPKVEVPPKVGEDGKPIEEKPESLLDVNDILETEHLKSEKELEVEKDEKKPKEKETPGSSEHTETSSSDPFALVYAKFLLESGSISSFDEEALKAVIDEEGEAKALQHLIKGEIDSAKAGISESLEGFQKEYVELRGLGIAPEDAANLVNSLEDVEAITEESVEEENNEPLRKNILNAYYKETTQFSDDRIKKLVDRSFELGDDVAETKEALESLKKSRKEYVANVKAKETKAIEDRKLDHQKSLENLRTKVDELTEIIPGQKINKVTKTKIEDMLTKPVKQLENGQVLNGVWAKRAENQLDFDMKLAHFINLGLFDGKLDILKKNAKTSAIDELEKHIEQKGSYRGSGTIPNADRKAATDMISSMR